MPTTFYDAHNHLQDEWLTPHRDRVIADLAAAGIKACVVNGTSEGDWADVSTLARQAPVVRPSFGLHPWDVGNRSADWKSALIAQLDANPGAMLGEIGIDRWMLDHARPNDPRLMGLRRAPMAEQSNVFIEQLLLAAERNVAASIHCLEAFGVLHELLSAAARPSRGFLLHAYSGPQEMVSNFAKLGGYFSFNGSFLDARKPRLREVYATIPADRLLVETDAPAMRLPSELERYSLPRLKGATTVNHPANLIVAYEGLAGIRGTSVERLADQVEENFFRLFGSP